MDANKILNRIENLNQFIEMILEEASAIRREVESGVSSSPLTGKKAKEKALEQKLLSNREKTILRGRSRNQNK